MGVTFLTMMLGKNPMLKNERRLTISFNKRGIDMSRLGAFVSNKKISNMISLMVMKAPDQRCDIPTAMKMAKEVECSI